MIISARSSSSSWLQTRPTGLCGLHRINILVRPSIFLLRSGQIHLPAIVFIYKRILNNPAAIIFDGRKKWIINRTLNNNFISRRGVGLNTDIEPKALRQVLWLTSLCFYFQLLPSFRLYGGRECVVYHVLVFSKRMGK